MRKLMYLLFTFILLFIVSACSLSEYDKSMEAGREYLRNEQYEKALTEFSNSLIEKPTDKDALALKKMTEDSIKKRDYHEQIIAFLEDTESAHKQLLEIARDYENSLSEVTVERALADIDKISEIDKNINSLSSKWSIDDTFSSAFNSLISSVRELSYVAEAVSENIVDENLDRTSRFAVLRSNDSKVRARSGLNSFNVDIREYEKEIIQFKMALGNNH